MPWIVEHSLVRSLTLKWQAQTGTPYSHTALLNDLSKYQKREKKGCSHEGDCECVVFGLYDADEYDHEWEYFVPPSESPSVHTQVKK